MVGDQPRLGDALAVHGVYEILVMEAFADEAPAAAVHDDGTGTVAVEEQVGKDDGLAVRTGGRRHGRPDAVGDVVLVEHAAGGNAHFNAVAQAAFGLQRPALVGHGDVAAAHCGIGAETAAGKDHAPARDDGGGLAVDLGDHAADAAVVLDQATHPRPCAQFGAGVEG